MLKVLQNLKDKVRVPSIPSGPIKWVAAFVVGIFFVFTVSIYAFTLLRPLSAYKDLVESHLLTASAAHEVNVDSLHWSYHPIKMSLSAVLTDLRLEKSPHFESVRVPETKLQLSLWSVLSRWRLHSHLHIQSPLLVLNTLKDPEAFAINDTPDAAADAQLEKSDALKEFPEPPRWAKSLGLSMHVSGLSIDASNWAEDSRLVSHLDITSRLQGVPGNFDLKVQGRKDISAPHLGLNGAGPWSLETKGKFGITESSLSVNLNKLHIDLSSLIIEMDGLLAKESGLRSVLNAKANIEWKVGKEASFDAKITEATLALSEMDIAIQAQHNSLSGSRIEWELDRKDLDALELPHPLLKDLRFQGLVESRGHLALDQRGDLTSKGTLSLNNLRAPSSGLPLVDQRASSGELVLSFFSDWSFKDSVLSSHRSELQFSATQARIESPDLGFNKDAGTPMSAFIKVSVVDDKLDIQNCEITAYNAALKGSGHIESLASFWNNKQEHHPVVKLSLKSNRIDLSPWSQYLYFIDSSQGLEGFLELHADVAGPLDISPENPTKNELKWTLRNLSASNIVGAFDGDAFEQMHPATRKVNLSGPFSFNLIANGRGQGSIIDQGEINSNLDLSRTKIDYKDSFRKPANTPLQAEFVATANANSLNIKQGNLHLHELELDFTGRLAQSSPQNRIELSMKKPIRLERWEELIPSTIDSPLKGEIQWNGSLAFPTELGNKNALDWRDLALLGELKFNDISTNLGPFKHPITKASGSIILDPTRIRSPNIRFQLKDSKIRMSAYASMRGTRGGPRGVVLSQWLSQKAWNVGGDLNIDKLDAESFALKADQGASPEQNIQSAPQRENMRGPASANDSGSIGQQLRGMLDTPSVKDSQANFKLSIGKGRFADIDFKNLATRFQWQNSLIKIDEIKTESMSGALSGSLHVDTQPYYQRRTVPEIRSTLKVESLDITELLKATKADFAPLMGGKLSANVVLASQGFEPTEWLQKSRGRIQGQLNNANFDTFKVLSEAFAQLPSLMQSGQVRAYLEKELRHEQCLRDQFSGKVDLQVVGGNIDIQESNLSFSTGSVIDVKGRLDSALNVDLKGRFLAGERCVSGDVRKCLADETSGPASIPFTIRGPASAATPEISYSEIGNKLLSCVSQELQNRAEAELKKGVDRGVKKIQDKAGEAARNLFKNF